MWTIGPEATVFEALEMMAAKNAGALVVTDHDRLAGIISERDSTRKGVLHDRRLSETLVRQIVTARVLTITSSHTIGECMALMTEKRIRHLPVVENYTLVGIVSIGDVVKSGRQT